MASPLGYGVTTVTLLALRIGFPLARLCPDLPFVARATMISTAMCALGSFPLTSPVLPMLPSLARTSLLKAPKGTLEPGVAPSDHP